MELLGPISLSDDIKEINKRGREIILICILVGLILSPIDYFQGLIFSSVLISSFTFSIGILYFLNQKWGISKVRIPAIIIIALALVLGIYGEGLSSGHLIYFFPMIIVIPTILEDHGKGKAEHFIMFFIAFLGILACVFIGLTWKPLELVSKMVSTQLFYTNLIFSFLVTVIFSFLNIKFEKRYIEAIHRQKNHSIAARTKFLSIMGHELRTPLNGIIGASNVLKEGRILEEQRDYLEILSYCSDHMLLLVNDILDFNKIEAGKLEIRPVSLNLKQMLVKSALPFTNLFEAKNLEFKTRIDVNLDFQVWADDVRIIQILNNLLSNSLKFTDQGFVELEATCKSIQEEEVEIYFSVLDTGSGIEEAHQKSIFDSFWQVYDESNRNFTGTGLGLSICMRLLELMNSTLKVESELGKGSRFYFTLKLPRAKGIEIKDPLSDIGAELEGYRVLLVEDNEINMLIAKKTLKDYKAQVVSVYNGAEALELMELDDQFDLFLMDLEMPVMNGYTAISPIRKSNPHIPVLGFTASLIDQEKFNYLIQLGFNECVLKPYQPRLLLEKIQKAIFQSRNLLSLPASSGTPTTSIAPAETSKSTPGITASETTT